MTVPDLAKRFACSPYGPDVEDDIAWSADHGFPWVAFMTDAGANGLLTWTPERIERVRRLCADKDVHLIIHTLSAVNVAEFVPHMTEAVDAYLAANVDLAAKLAAQVIVHAGMHFSERIDLRTKVSIEHIGRAVKRAEAAGVTLMLENMNRGPKEAEVHYIGCASSELRPYFDAIQSPSLKWAFSANHAHLTTEDWSGFLDTLGTDRLGIVMMADCHGTIEEHLWPGKGTLDFGALLARLERARYGGPYFLTFGPKDALLAGREYIIERATAALAPAR
jgi:sugar phosphate isomerase/epimerase